MKQSTISSRGHLFSFTNPYFHNSYVILGSNQILVCDTSCGPEPMEHVKRFIEAHTGNEQQIIVFNSHHHYDHVWGNSVFAAESIYAHQTCYESLKKHGHRDLIQFASHKRGHVKLLLPNQTFTDVVLLDNGAIELFYSPGHTLDSSSCLDHLDKVLFVGDNVESPIPYVFDGDIDQYIATLVEYKSLDWKYLITGHDSVQTDQKLLDSNIEYLGHLRDWDLSINKLPSEARFRHIENMVKLANFVNPSELGVQTKLRLLEAQEMLQDLVGKNKEIHALLEAINELIAIL